jgi:opacity protein-like surface antigen
MTALSNSILPAAVCAVAVLLAASAANATPDIGSVRPLEQARQGSGLVHQVQYRGRHHRYSGYRYRSNSGRNLALGIGGAIIGGIVLSEAARAQHRREYGSDWQRCADTYRSFESDTGMYTGYDGVRRTCPYLR